MSFSASSAHSNTDERVLDVQFTEDAHQREPAVTAESSPCRSSGIRACSTPLPPQRKNWKIAGGGYGIHWPDIDEDLSTEGLLRGAPAPKASINAK